ncbi:MAG TPA: hypothetical protein EYN06_04840 [Myxococcales bacterium]|nr:hypothetical protein [Myxococcales bacterium]HIN85789.1 hypothetical protein [Myxococcales bacterium]
MKQLFLSIVILLLVPLSTALALPAPMSAEELVAASDIIIEGEVTQVECMGQELVPDESTTNHYRATVTVLDVIKGEPGDSVIVDFKTIKYVEGFDVAACSGSGQSHPLGQIGTYHLTGPNDESVFAPPSWSAFTESDDSSPGDLESCEELPATDGADGTGSTDGAPPVKQVTASSESSSGCTSSPGSNSSSGLLLSVCLLIGLCLRRSSFLPQSS